MLRERVKRLLIWFEPLVTEKGADGLRSASFGRIMAWVTFFVDLLVVRYSLFATTKLPHIDAAFSFMEWFSVVIFGYVFAGKTTLNKNKFGVFGNGGGVSNGGNGSKAGGVPKAPAQP